MGLWPTASASIGYFYSNEPVMTFKGNSLVRTKIVIFKKY